MAQHLDPDFVFKIVTADFLKEIGPVVGQLQAVHLSVRAKQAAVESRDAGSRIALVNTAKQVEKVLPARIGYARKRGDALPRGDERIRRQEVPIFAKRDENDSV